MSEGSKNVNEVLRWVDAGRTVQVWDPLHECWTLATHQDRGSVRHWIRAGGAFRVVPGVHGGVPRSDAGDDPTPAEQAADLTQEVERLSAENARLREALRQVHEIANRPDLWTEEVVERVIDRVSDALAAASLSETGGE